MFLRGMHKISLYKKGRAVSLLLLFFSISGKSDAQIDFVKKVLHKYLSNEKDTTRKPSFIPLPNLSYAQETGLKVGVTGLYSFYTDRKDPNIKNSTIEASISYTEKKQTSTKLLTEIWTKNNDYRLYGELRYQNFPYNFYGIGANTLKADKNLINEKRFRFMAAADKRIFGKYYLGFITEFEHFKYEDKEPGGFFEKSNLVGKGGGKYISLGIEQFVDNRNTNTYTTKGQFAKLTLNYVPDFFGGDNYNGGIVQFNYRYFQPLNNKFTLGLNGIFNSLTSHDAPFYLLQRLGSDQIMRGYYQGRYNDRNYTAAQAELRYRFVPRFGIVAFGGVGSVYGISDFSGNLKPNYGGGLRYFFDLERSLSVRIDYGWGEKVPGEKRQGGVYFSLGEAF
ncbi:MAG: polymerase [Pseudopedobacter saltans]|uniref:Polymerase n=1 Tax=Pseudopedobacter saltans TaxID=151895 RepID=A0A2W5F8R2_9SPHI|nr:MAG: polymerase [Pseudopedobacter saltans]